MTLAYYFAAADPSECGGWRVVQREAEGERSDETVPLATARARRDAEWVRRINEDDRAAFSDLYREYLESMVGFAFRIVRSLTVAEDLCADIFVAVWEQRERWQPKHGARAYLFNAVRMRALNHVRHDATVSTSRGAVAEQYRQDPRGNVYSIEDRLDFDRKIASIRSVIASMPEMRRRVMQLRWHDGFEIAEIAEVLGVSRAAVDQHLSRGLRAIREQLPELMAEE